MRMAHPYAALRSLTSYSQKVCRVLRLECRGCVTGGNELAAFGAWNCSPGHMRCMLTTSWAGLCYTCQLCRLGFGCLSPQTRVWVKVDLLTVTWVLISMNIACNIICVAAYIENAFNWSRVASTLFVKRLCHVHECPVHGKLIAKNAVCGVVLAQQVHR